MESDIETQIIGGMFGLGEMPNPNSSSLPFQEGRAVQLVNARSGIAILLEILSPARVWMPSYLCDTMLSAVDGCKSELRFYEVNYDLTMPSPDWHNDVNTGDLAVVVDYFGFQHDRSCFARIKERGGWILEDACHAFLNRDVGRFSDFVLFSPRKYLGVPDGGILVFNCRIDVQHVQLAPPPAKWWLKAFHACVLRREFDLHGGTRRWFELFQESENNCPVGHYAMSEFSKMLLLHGFDYSSIAKKRIENYMVLLEKLNELALFSVLPPGIVPFGFPIRLKNRDQVRQALFNNGIYPPIHWAVPGQVPERFTESRKLADEIMTLPCDQRYGRKDMERMADVILGELKI